MRRGPRTTAVTLARWSGYGLAALPLAFAPVSVRLRVPRRWLRSPVRLERPGPLRVLAHSVLSGGSGLVGWFLALLALVALTRGLAYPVLTGDDYANSWGGPTLAGAWAVHAVLGVALLPVWLLAIAGLGAVQWRLAQRLLGRTGPPWAIPLSIALAAAGALLFIAWTRQL
ncbi:hypothetical protein IU444_08790 [Nocardia farcinica]|nr:hypothetical protein [Nocardia farcinica]MBF6536432.1 hypothetical protein [Nocardia farcinica]